MRFVQISYTIKFKKNKNKDSRKKKNNFSRWKKNIFRTAAAYWNSTVWPLLFKVYGRLNSFTFHRVFLLTSIWILKDDMLVYKWYSYYLQGNNIFIIFIDIILMVYTIFIHVIGRYIQVENVFISKFNLIFLVFSLRSIVLIEYKWAIQFNWMQWSIYRLFYISDLFDSNKNDILRLPSW